MLFGLWLPLILTLEILLQPPSIVFGTDSLLFDRPSPRGLRGPGWGSWGFPSRVVHSHKLRIPLSFTFPFSLSLPPTLHLRRSHRPTVTTRDLGGVLVNHTASSQKRRGETFSAFRKPTLWLFLVLRLTLVHSYHCLVSTVVTHNFLFWLDKK